MRCFGAVFRYLQNLANLNCVTKPYLCVSVYKQIFFLDRIEYRILFVQAKSTKSNIKYYSFCKKYSNNIRMVQNIRIFKYFWIILNDKMKNNIKNLTLKIANETWTLDTKGLKKFEFLQLRICCKIILSCQKWNWNFQNLCISSDFLRHIFGIFEQNIWIFE